MASIKIKPETQLHHRFRHHLFYNDACIVQGGNTAPPNSINPAL